MKKRIRYAIAIVALVIIGPFVWSRMASPSRRVSVHEVLSNQTAPNSDGAIRVACYNIAHGRGLAKDNWTNDSPAERLSRLDDIAELLQSMDADIVALNEADFDSSWSHGVNQAAYLAEKAGYAHWSTERNLDFRIATRTWRFGNAVLSRFPITAAKDVSFPSYQTWETWLAGKKRGLLCEIDLGSRKIAFVSAHLSHRSEHVRVESADMLCDMAASSKVPFIVAGDLNSTPSGFALSSKDSDGRNAVETFDTSGYFQRQPPIMPGSTGMTFHADRPTHVIDWILIPRNAAFDSYEVIHSKLSDHRPVVADIKLPETKLP